MIGIDIVDANRFLEIKKEDFLSWKKVFTESEWQYCFGKPKPSRHLAGIFAAKEAIMKALGKNLMKRYDCIEIVHNQYGKPIADIKISNNRKAEVSISHDAGFVVATAIEIL